MENIKNFISNLTEDQLYDWKRFVLYEDYVASDVTFGIYVNILDKCVEKCDNYLTGEELREILEYCYRDKYPALRETLIFEACYIFRTGLIDFTYEDEEHEDMKEPNGIKVNFEAIEEFINGERRDLWNLMENPHKKSFDSFLWGMRWIIKELVRLTKWYSITYNDQLSEETYLSMKKRNEFNDGIGEYDGMS